MNRSTLLAALLCAPALCVPAHADEVGDLKAEIAAQKQAAEAQRLRLDALERKLNAMQTQPAAQAGAPAAPLPVALTTDQQGVKLDPDSTAITLYSNANTSLRLYGLLEATISHTNHQTAPGGSATGFQTAWFSGNRLGFDAEHVLGFGQNIGMPDLKVISKLETEFELPTGNSDTANVLFNRDAWLGFYSDTLGKITLGRQNTLTRDFTQNWGDPYGTAEVTLKEGGYSNVNNFKQLIFYSGSANGTRVNSGIEWKKKLDDHVVLGLGYSFGSGGAGGSGDVGNGGSTPGDFTKGTTQAASVAYNKLMVGPAVISLNASYDRANVADLIHQSELFGGNATFGGFRLNAGIIHYTAEQGPNNSAGKRTDNSWTTSVSYTLDRMEYDLGYQVMKGSHAGFSGGGTTLNPFGNTSGVTMTADGKKSTVYGSIFYHADRQLDLYFAADYFTVGGNWLVGDAQGNGLHFGTGQPFKNETEVAVGARFKF
jgi:predicted porin